MKLQHYPPFKDMMQSQRKALPYHVIKEFEELLKCGRFEYGFLRVVCDDCKHAKLVAFSGKRSNTGAATYIQRFGSALNYSTGEVVNPSYTHRE